MATWMRCCLGPMPQNSAWPPASSPGTSARPCTSVTSWRQALCSSTRTTRPTWPPPSEASSSLDLAKTWVT
uniref:Aldehyde dehydrogenase 1 family member L1 n=1 Tax=Pipistrellus kuhlii TaxID=59472 RepID=A0A7J7Y7L9_PIPKU|nr:aldehyde dehydrogenase 1 family member L1 [Pipistrellus kuhlii]